VKKGFTIVELLIVIGVLAILMGLVGTAASSALRQGRERRMSAMKQVLQTGVAAYYARNGYWPPKSGELNKLLDGEGSQDNDSPTDLVLLSEEDSTLVFREVVQKSVQSASAPYLDVSGLYVANSSAASSPNTVGLDFKTAIKQGASKGTGQRSKLGLADMAFGYPDARSSRFRRYYVEYNVKGDTVRVLSYADIYNNRWTSPYNVWWRKIIRFDPD